MKNHIIIVHVSVNEDFFGETMSERILCSMDDALRGLAHTIAAGFNGNAIPQWDSPTYPRVYVSGSEHERI